MPPRYGATSFKRNNKNHTDVAISGATSESGKRHEPVAQVRWGGDRLCLYHGNHRIDVYGLEPEHLFAVDLPLCSSDRCLERRCWNGSHSARGTGKLSKRV